MAANMSVDYNEKKYKRPTGRFMKLKLQEEKDKQKFRR